MFLKVSTCRIAVTTIVLGFGSLASAHASCGAYASPSAAIEALSHVKPAAYALNSHSTGDWDGDDNKVDPIVGLWQVRVVALGNAAPFPADGTLLDQGFSVWHSDGTEILNSAKDPATSNFCLGTWKKIGRSTYRLNHFAISWAVKNGVSMLQGATNIREDIVLEGRGDRYVGTFSVTDYTTAGEVIDHVTGKITGTRLNVDSKANPLM